MITANRLEQIEAEKLGIWHFTILSGADALFGDMSYLL